MRDNEARRLTGSLRPEDDVEVEHARAPTHPPAAAEVPFKPLEAGQESRGLAIGLEDQNGIGESAPGGPERGRRVNRGNRLDREILPQRRDCSAQIVRGAAMAARAVGTERDRVAAQMS